jgi:tRNA wybutosine-synthesizing protein 4
LFLSHYFIAMASADRDIDLSWSCSNTDNALAMSGSESDIDLSRSCSNTGNAPHWRIPNATCRFRPCVPLPTLSLSICRRAHTATALNSEHILIFGGFGIAGDRSGKSRPTATHSRLAATEILRVKAAGEVALAELDLEFEPEPRLYHTAVEVEGDVYLFGGRQGPRRPFDDLYVFSGKSQKWTKIERREGAPWPAARFRHATVAVEPNKLLIHGGIGADGEVLNDAWFFDVSESSWIRTPDTELPRLHSHQITAQTEGCESHFISFLGGRQPDGDIKSNKRSYRLELMLSTSLEELQLFGDDDYDPSRYGSSVSLSSNNRGMLVVSGGIAVPESSPHSNYVHEPLYLVDIGKEPYKPVPLSLDSWKPRLFVDHTMTLLSVNTGSGGDDEFHDRIVILGGGATCFSFGSAFDDEVVVLDPILAPRKKPVSLPLELIPLGERLFDLKLNNKQASGTAGSWDFPTAVGTRAARSLTASGWDEIFEKQHPVVIRGCDLGACLKKWTPNYLTETLASKKVRGPLSS